MFLLTSLVVFLVSLDVSIANAVLPAMGASFGHPGRAALSWVLTAYAITFAAALVPAGRLADRAGRRRVFRLGILIFGVGSVVCGAAANLPMMLLGRVLQAVGAASAQPASLGLLVTAVPVERRATYVARWGGMGAVGIGLGPSLGGFITASSSWRLAFLINVPLIAVALFYSPRLLVETPRHPGRRIPDPLGAVLLAGTAAVLTLGISEASTWGVGSPRIIGIIVVGCVLAALFGRRSMRVSDPVLDLRLLRQRRTALVTIVTVLYSAGFFGLLFSFVLFLTGPWHLSLSQAGIALTPMPVAAIIVITFVGALSDRVGFRLPLAAGTACMSIGLLVSVVVDRGHTFSPVWIAVVAFIGFGVGLCYPLLSAAAVADEPAEHLAAVAAVNQCARQLGAALGIAATVAAVGPAPSAPVANFHAAWIVCAIFAAAASAAALGLRRPEHG
ncbi:MAG: MFS transporter [Actinomycetota bacterium]|nr:MFS transporter [Actinomycetota bacterium]